MSLEDSSAPGSDDVCQTCQTRGAPGAAVRAPAAGRRAIATKSPALRRASRDVIYRPVSELHIRNATAQDLELVLELWGETGSPGPTDTRESLTALLASDPQSVLVAEISGRASGTLIAVWDGWRGSFYRLAVRSGHRRQGIAKALLRAGERRLRDCGAIRVTALIDDRDPVAVAFWRSAGYAPQPHTARFVRHLD